MNHDTKKKAACELLEHFLGKHQRDHTKKLSLLINEELVALFIGQSGKSIKKLKGKCRTDIVVRQPIPGFKYRPVDIRGYIEDVIYSCE